MMRAGLSLGRLALLAVVSAAVGLWVAQPLSSTPHPIPSLPVLVPFVVDAVRHPVNVAAQLLVYYPGLPSSSIRVERLRVGTNGKWFVDRPVFVDLIGDPRYGSLNALLERLPVELTERHRQQRFFADPHAPEFVGQEVIEVYHQVARLLGELRRDYAAPGNKPFVHLNFKLPLGELFTDDTLPGEVRSIVMEVDYRGDDGVLHTAAVEHTLRRLAPIPEVPTSLSVSLAAEVDSATIHAGDLHVHSCHGEALDACAPSSNCLAETLEVSGSFTFEELKSQYQALGIDWFTSTDHSYCINSDEEYQVIVDEIAAITDPSFIAYPDTEVSAEEEGQQKGTDLGTLLCLGLTQPNHLGAHGIQSRKPGGSDGLLGFCGGQFGEAPASFIDNAAAIRAEGGYPVVNHPADAFWAWNSIEATGGIESNMMHGVEIWNGDFVSGQRGHRGIWVNWLLSGRILYAYSGSDTHDEAFAFGANHVLLFQPFTLENLRAAIMQGQVYISNEHLLIITIEADGTQFLMGDRIQVIPDFSPTSLEIQVHYDFSTDFSTITIFRGWVGDNTEAILCSSAPLTGSGMFTCTDTLSPNVGSYYRAYSEDQTVAKTAYTNPIFFPGSP